MSGLRADADAMVSPILTAQAGRIKRRPSVWWWLAGLAVGVAVVVGIIPELVPYSPTAIDTASSLSPPSGEHLLGTDQLGRDIASRVAHGARLSMLVAASATTLALVAGCVLGALAAAGPKWLSDVILRLTDIALAFPGILLAIVLAAVIGPSTSTTVIVLAVAYTPSLTRVVRAAVYDEYGEDYVTASRLIGTTKVRLVGYHIGKNAALPVAAYATLILADAIVAEAALSFIGAGIKPPAPSWGNIIRDGQVVVYAGAWWVSVFPGIAIVATAFCLNRVADGIGRILRAA